MAKSFSSTGSHVFEFVENPFENFFQFYKKRLINTVFNLKFTAKKY